MDSIPQPPPSLMKFKSYREREREREREGKYFTTVSVMSWIGAELTFGIWGGQN
jgi:hypothetical protein